MRQPSLRFVRPSLAVLLSACVLAQDQVEIQFQTDPMLVQTGTEIVFTVLTVSQVLSMTWQYQGVTLGLWAGGASVVNPAAQFEGRVTISATQLRVGGAQLRDAGNYTVQVIPLATTGLDPNSRTIQLRVFDAVAGISLFVPTVAVEERNVSLKCTWTAGTEITVQWGKGGATITTDSRITISDGFLVINPARRGDAGEYSCSVSNPVSAQTVRQSLTVYYGPDTPVLTKDAPKECVGDGDVLVGQTVRLTCISDSLPPALFSWQRDGQSVTSGQPDSGVLSLQTFSTDESGRYVCAARNGITGGTSEQETVLAVVETCLDGGEVAGIVIGCLLLIIIIVVLIWLIVFLMRKRRAVVQKPYPNRRQIPPEPQPNGARDLGHGPQPPPYYMNRNHPDHFYTSPRENRNNPQTLVLNGLQSTNTHRHNGHTHPNRLLHNSIQNGNSYPHNGIDNPAFTHVDDPNANAFPNTQQQNPNILIQPGHAQGGAHLPAVQVSLNTLPQNNSTQIPTIHFNLNSYATNGQQTQQESSFPLTSTSNNNASQTQQSLIHAGQSNPTMEGGLNGPVEAGHQGPPGLIPNGYTHFNSSHTLQRNANTQTYQQELEHPRTSDRNSVRHDSPASSPRRQMPWDRLRGTPAYPSGSLPRRQTSPEFSSNSTDHPTHPPTRDERNRSQRRPQSQATSRSTAPPREDVPTADRRTRSRSLDLLDPNTHSGTQLEVAHHTHRSPNAQRESVQRDIRGSPRSQTAPRQEVTHGINPQARPPMSWQASVGRTAVSKRPMTQQGQTALQGADTRALADPNHLPQAHMAQQHRAAPIQKPPQGLGTQTQPVINDAIQRRQEGTAPALNTPAQPHPSNLAQAALKTHTQRAQTLQNRKQQTQAALLHSGPQAQPPAAGARHPPTPPPVIPILQFQALPKKRTQHRSLTRGPQPPRPPVNMPVAQRPLPVQQRPNMLHQHATMPTTSRHRPGNGAHRHAHAHPHAHHRHPVHSTHPRQQQAHRGRTR